MDWTKLLSLVGVKSRTAQLTERIAAGCQQPVLERTLYRAVTLPTAQMRGFIRARATYAAAHEADRVLATIAPMKPGDRSRIVAGAIERVVVNVESEIAARRRTVRRALRAA